MTASSTIDSRGGIRGPRGRATLLREAERFCERSLPRVSRTFALSVRVLPGTLGRTVLTAYLICRIADTVEDGPSHTAEEKAEMLAMLLACFADEAAAEEFGARCSSLTGDAAHVDLARNAEHVFRLFRSLPDRSRTCVERWASEMIRGMREFVLRYPAGVRIQTLAEYREYCYYVAGTVGYLLTDLWHEHSRSIGPETYRELWKRSRLFAEALQTVNILKDVSQDARGENSVYVPEQLLREHGSSHERLLAEGHLSLDHGALRRLGQVAREGLEGAKAYVLDIPRRAVSIRLFCILPLLYAYATMRELEATSAGAKGEGRGRRPIKISRAEVRALLIVGTLLILSNRALTWLLSRVRVRPFRFLIGARV